MLLLLTGIILLSPDTVQADGDPRRLTTIEVSYTEYEWWLVYWQDGTIACKVFIDHDMEPTAEEIYNHCGKKVYDLWMASAPCLLAGSSLQDVCVGMYLYENGSYIKNKTIEIELPNPRVWVDIKDCISVRGTELCAEIPVLLITAEEPLPNEKIEKIQGRLNGIPFLCYENTCELPLRETAVKGVSLEFWADSSFGDSTQQYQGKIRVAKSLNEIPFTSGWRIDIVSEHDDFNTLAGCAELWQSFPPLGTPPEWLSDPQHAHLLETDEPYTYLAGQLIQRGYIDVSDCDYFGLLPNGYASQCGLEKSRGAVKLWQNTFDQYFILASSNSGIPSQLLKRIFAKESQFWPETFEHVYYEYGPGHINEMGADTALFWNRIFFDQFCPLFLAEHACQLGYAQLDDWSKVLLRGAFLSKIEMDLPDLDLRVDPIQAQASVSLFAEALLGNCSQVGQIVSYQTDKVPGEVVSNEDLWRFTLVNYHAGSGCLARAVNSVDDQDQSLTWENISRELEYDCPWANNYVAGIVH
jgi:hypothetical protein